MIVTEALQSCLTSQFCLLFTYFWQSQIVES